MTHTFPVDAEYVFRVFPLQTTVSNVRGLQYRGTEEQSVATIELPLAAGVDVNLRNNRGETALHGAADRGADTVVRFLVENGARLDLEDKSNRTALDMAMGVPPATGRNPFEYRERYGHESTAELLRELMTARGVAIEPYVKP